MTTQPTDDSRRQTQHGMPRCRWCGKPGKRFLAKLPHCGNIHTAEEHRSLSPDDVATVQAAILQAMADRVKNDGAQ
jgi:hypothetical protein